MELAKLLDFDPKLLSETILIYFSKANFIIFKNLQFLWCASFFSYFYYYKRFHLTIFGKIDFFF